MNFKERSTLTELMDDPDISDELLIGTLKDIALVNRYLGGNQITVKALKKIIRNHPTKKKWTIVDVGCSDGESLRDIVGYFKKEDVDINFVGLDINARSIEIALSKSEGMANVSFRVQDILEIEEKSFECDVIICTLTMHHFGDGQLLEFLSKFQKLASIAIIINDLQRSKLSYRLFQLFSSIFIKSKVAKYDGKVSIASGFKRKDLESYSKKLALTDYYINWKWAFRYVWVIRNI